MLSITHGFGRVIDEISVGDIFINGAGVHKKCGDRLKEAFDIVDIEIDDDTYQMFNDYIKTKKAVDKKIKKLFSPSHTQKFLD